MIVQSARAPFSYAELAFTSAMNGTPRNISSRSTNSEICSLGTQTLFSTLFAKVFCLVERKLTTAVNKMLDTSWHLFFSAFIKRNKCANSVAKDIA